MEKSMNVETDDEEMRVQLKNRLAQGFENRIIALDALLNEEDALFPLAFSSHRQFWE